MGGLPFNAFTSYNKLHSIHCLGVPEKPDCFENVFFGINDMKFQSKSFLAPLFSLQTENKVKAYNFVNLGLKA